MQVFSIILATSLRALEIALCAFYPNMPRFALLRSALSWVSRGLASLCTLSKAITPEADAGQESVGVMS